MDLVLDKILIMNQEEFDYFFHHPFSHSHILERAKICRQKMYHSFFFENAKKCETFVQCQKP